MTLPKQLYIWKTLFSLMPSAKRLQCLLVIFVWCYAQTSWSQGSGIIGANSQQESVRGKLTPRKRAMDVQHYDLNLWPDLEDQSLRGRVTIEYNLAAPTDSFQIDLLAIWTVDTVLLNREPIGYRRNGNIILVANPKQQLNETNIITIVYNGSPLRSTRPPWSAGFVWSQDSLGRPWIGVACEGQGASTWWPCKDHPSDEPEKGVLITCTYPSNLMFVSNGKLIADRAFKFQSIRTTTWQVSSPINLYNVTFNLGYYAKTKTSRASNIRNAKGGSNTKQQLLSIELYLLDYHKQKANAVIAEAKKMLDIFEDAFGPYPYYQDGYKLVETPYYGMEHQSCIAYGNGFKKNAFGFDFILVHESGHEWWGNQLSVADHADLWLHESWCTYSELVYVEQTLGKASAFEYATNWLAKIKNQSPMQGPNHVAYNGWLDSDIYYKGAAMIMTLRLAIDNEPAWQQAVKDFASIAKQKPIRTETAVSYWVNVVNSLQQANETQLSGQAVAALFAHYLRYKELPILELKQTNAEKYHERWAARFVGVVDDFVLPITCLAPNDGVTKILIGNAWTDLGHYGAPQTKGLAIKTSLVK
jgi:aminopeptidase N